MKDYIDRPHMLLNHKVCHGCFNNKGIINMIKEDGELTGCNFCSSAKRAHKLGDVIDYINNCLTNHYEDPANSMGYNTKEGGYTGTTFDSYDLLFETGLEVDDDLHSIISNNLPTGIWCKRDPYGLTYDKELEYNWMDFTNLVKHKCRFMFMKHETRRDTIYDNQNLISDILDNIKDVIESYDLIKVLKKGTKIYRARHQSKKTPFKLTVDELSPPPENLARNSRMSPAGIPMFYGSQKIQTALKEIKALENDNVAICNFILEEDISIIDLTTFPQIEDIFDNINEYDLARPKFLRSFLEDFTKEIEKDGKEHIDYVPTQVVTEFCKYNIKHNNQFIKGFKFPSSVDNGEAAYCLFIDRFDCGVTIKQNRQKKPLILKLSKTNLKFVIAKDHIKSQDGSL